MLWLSFLFSVYNNIIVILQQQGKLLGGELLGRNFSKQNQNYIENKLMQLVNDMVDIWLVVSVNYQSLTSF